MISAVLIWKDRKYLSLPYILLQLKCFLVSDLLFTDVLLCDVFLECLVLSSKKVSFCVVSTAHVWFRQQQPQQQTLENKLNFTFSVKWLNWNFFGPFVIHFKNTVCYFDASLVYMFYILTFLTLLRIYYFRRDGQKKSHWTYNDICLFFGFKLSRWSIKNSTVR